MVKSSAPDSNERQRQTERAARSMIERYGKRAWQEARVRAVELDTLGESDSSAFWEEIARTILELSKTIP